MKRAIEWANRKNPRSIYYIPKYNWSKRSREVLVTLTPDLIYLMNKLADVRDVSLIWGYRDKELQNSFYRKGTGVRYPFSKHNVYPSLAVDVVPYPSQYDSIEELNMMLGSIQALSHMLNITIRLGKYFPTRKDYAHIEIATI